MFSLNIKDYIIAGLLLVIVALGFVTFYDKTRITILEDYKEKSTLLAKQQRNKIALLKEHSKKTEEYLNEKYDVELSMLNTTIGRLREHNTSLMPSIPPTSRDTTTACFQREAIDEAISRYRAGVQGLVRKGSEAQLGLNIAKEWVAEEIIIYNEDQ